MEQATSTANIKIASGKDRRAHVRHPISINLDIMIQGLGQRKAKARDFCMGGLLIAFDPDNPLPVKSDLTDTICLVTLHIDKDDYRLRAKIAHADTQSAGLAFINPDNLALQAMQKHARIDAQPSHEQHTGSTERNVEKESSHTSPEIQKQQLLALCNAVIQNNAQRIITSFFEEADNRLFNTAKSSQEAELQNLHFQTLEMLGNSRFLITSTFSNYLNTKLQSNLTLSVETESDRDDKDDQDESLALISDKEFNIWLESSKVMHKIESEYAQLIGALERRLSVVYQQDVDRKNNPYGPSLFVQAFQHTVEELELSAQVLPVCYEAFKGALLESAQEIYTNLNQVLIDNEILPNMKDIYRSTRKNTKHEKQEKDEAQSEADQDSSEDDSTVKPVESDTKEAKPDHTSDERISAQNLYQIVGEIRQLQSLLHQQTGNVAVTGESAQAQQLHPVSGQPAALNLPAYSTAEALDVISKFQPTRQSFLGNGQSLSDFRNKLNEFLIENRTAPGQKTLSTEHNQVIDVTENVFTSLLNDLQVAQSVRPWLERLAIPVMKMALLDENIFTDKNHVVRSVINKLAELEVLASAEDEEEQAAVQQAFNWVINLVNNEFDGTTNVYARAAQQLDILIKVQQQSFERNLKTVVAEAIREEREHTSRESGKTTTDTNIASMDDESWLRMVSRLKENHWVLFDTFTDDPKRLKVAWIAPRNGKYVFVNVMGRKERICTNNKLAELFRTGEAIVLDGSDDPAMDRAQYTMLQKLHKQLLHQSTHDELTGLINRREFTNCMQAALDDAIQNNSKHAVCFLDLDDFKVINNNYGYDAGDQLLKQFVELVKTSMDGEPILSRIGADHFALMLRGTSMDDAVENVEQIMDALHDYRFEWQDNRLSVTMSTGIAMINASTDNMIDLLHSAESSCSMAKESGGNQIQIFHAGSNRISRRKQETEWATKIDKALEENELFLRCQKIIPIQHHMDERPHYEILLGISEEAGGNSMLETFIKAAEHHNRMLAVDRWVIQNTFQWLADNEDTTSDISLFTINLSGHSLNNENLIEFVYQQADKTCVPIERICFEITETAGVSNLSDAADFIQTIKGTGCQFALDDFGSGMSSYSYLKNLPVDYLKIDGAFIKEITTNQNDYAVAKSICEIGHFMEKTVIAEFVQDDAALKLLRQIGVDYGQGFGIAKPHKLNDLLY